MHELAGQSNADQLQLLLEDCCHARRSPGKGTLLRNTALDKPCVARFALSRTLLCSAGPLAKIPPPTQPAAMDVHGLSKVRFNCTMLPPSL